MNWVRRMLVASREASARRSPGWSFRRSGRQARDQKGVSKISDPSVERKTPRLVIRRVMNVAPWWAPDWK